MCHWATVLAGVYRRWVSAWMHGIAVVVTLRQTIVGIFPQRSRCITVLTHRGPKKRCPSCCLIVNRTFVSQIVFFFDRVPFNIHVTTNRDLCCVVVGRDGLCVVNDTIRVSRGGDDLIGFILSFTTVNNVICWNQWSNIVLQRTSVVGHFGERQTPWFIKAGLTTSTICRFVYTFDFAGPPRGICGCEARVDGRWDDGLRSITCFGAEVVEKQLHAW